MEAATEDPAQCANLHSLVKVAAYLHNLCG